MQLLDPQDAYKPVDEKGFIRSYAGLNDETSRRIRNFELETRAMLYRDDRSPNSSVINVGTNKSIKGIEDIKKEQMKLDDAIRQAKHELETEDIFDQIADNPSSMSPKWCIIDVLKFENQCKLSIFIFMNTCSSCSAP